MAAINTARVHCWYNMQFYWCLWIWNSHVVYIAMIILLWCVVAGVQQTSGWSNGTLWHSKSQLDKIKFHSIHDLLLCDSCLDVVSIHDCTIMTLYSTSIILQNDYSTTMSCTLLVVWSVLFKFLFLVSFSSILPCRCTIMYVIM